MSRQKMFQVFFLWLTSANILQLSLDSITATLILQARILEEKSISTALVIPGLGIKLQIKDRDMRRKRLHFEALIIAS